MKLFDRFFKKDSISESYREPPIVWNMADHKGWGDSIYMVDWDKRKIKGLTRPRASVGDEVRVDMESGRTARLRVKSVDYRRDPHDLWYADLTDMGYLDEDPDAPPTTLFSVFGAPLCSDCREPLRFCNCKEKSS